MLLTPYRVLDLTGPLGWLAGRILADLGADVVKVEPPGGDPERRQPPFLAAAGAEPQGLNWLAQNVNKRSITLDLESEPGRLHFQKLVASSDFLLETFRPGYLDSLGLGYGALCLLNPRLIMVSITPYGQTGPHRDMLASDIEIMAMGGAMSLTGAADGEPMRCAAPQAPGWVGSEAAVGALTALAHRAASGRGQRVDVSAQAAVLSAIAHAPVFWDMLGVNPKRAGVYITGRSVTGAHMRAFWPCKDGWINFIIYGGVAGRRTNEQLVAWMKSAGQAPDWMIAIDWKTFEVTRLTQEEVDRFEAPIYTFLQGLTKQEFLDGAVAREMLGYPVYTVADIHADRQLAARDFWRDVPDETTGTSLHVTGGFAVIDGTRLPVRRGAPRVGQHNDEVLSAAAAHADPSSAR